MMKRSGFSMLELVVVMLIMGTLAGIAISKMGGSDTGARKAGMKSDIRGAIATINACYADQLDYQKCDATAELTALGLTIPQTDGNVTRITASTGKNIFPTITVTVDTGNGFTAIPGLANFTYTNTSQSITETAAARS